MTKKEFDKISSSIVREFYKKKFILTAVVVQGQEIGIFEDIPFSFVESSSNYLDSYAKIDDEWLEHHKDWKKGEVFKDSYLFMSADRNSLKYREIFWGPTKEEALDIMIFCMNKVINEIEEEIIKLNMDKSRFYDIFHFAEMERKDMSK